MQNAGQTLELGEMTEPVLVFGGPYSNLAALLALREEADRHGIPAGRVICTGDVVAYCAEPQETVTSIRDWSVHVLMGNCEESLGWDAPDCGCGYAQGSTCEGLSQAWYAFARKHISNDSRAWMRSLPRHITFTMANKRLTVVHGAVSSINRFIFASADRSVIEAELALADADIVLAGHCGIPFGREAHRHHWLNAGVIGMPANDGTREGWYMLMEPDAGVIHVSWHRLAYPCEQSHQAMLNANLNNGYAASLLSGLWPSMDILPDPERARQGKPIELSPLVIA